MTDRAKKSAERSLDQRMAALQQANQIRSERAQLKKDLRSGEASVFRILESPPDFLESAKVIDLLTALPSFGAVKANRLLSRCRISPLKTVGGLSRRQRKEIIGRLQ